jgi:hypothetical protein
MSSDSDSIELKDCKRFAAAFMDESDRYGEAYRRQIQESNWFECFFCNVGLADWSIACATCHYDYRFCKQCVRDQRIVLGCGTCCFCLRRLCDDVRRRLDSSAPLPTLRQDSYGVATLLALLAQPAQPAQPTDRAPRRSQRRKQTD